MKTKHAAGYLVALSGIAVAIAFVMLPNSSIALAQQQTNPANGTTATQIPSNNQTYQSPNSMTMNSANWTSSISLFSSIIDAFYFRINKNTQKIPTHTF